MRVTALVEAVAITIVITSPVPAQVLTNGTLSGKIVSVSKNVPCIAGSSPVFTVPSTGHFILTQICYRGCGTCKTLSFDEIPSQFTDECRTFTPGLALVPGEHVVCNNTSACGACTPRAVTLTGVLSAN